MSLTDAAHRAITDAPRLTGDPIHKGDCHAPTPDCYRPRVCPDVADGAGKAEVSRVDVAAPYFGGRQRFGADGDLLVHFDRGDVAWLRGYCHLLMALAEVGLAYDGQELFDATAHLFFHKPRTPFPFL